MSIIFDKEGLSVNTGFARIFYYSNESKEFVGWSDEYFNIGVSMPINSTFKEPGTPSDKKVFIFNGKNWVATPDHRGEVVYSIENHEKITIEEIGPYPDGITTLEPSSEYDEWSNGAWVTNEESKHKACVARAEVEKNKRIELANDFINRKQWPGKLALGRITSDEIEDYNNWLDYLDFIDAVDTSTAPNIEWSTSPADG